MNKLLGKLWRHTQPFLKKVGDIQSRILLMVVYFTFLLPIGIIVRIFSDTMASKPKDKHRSSYWVGRQLEMPDDLIKARRQY